MDYNKNIEPIYFVFHFVLVTQIFIIEECYRR